jgi:16S rRNA (guanine527-N7)-methyltransferase
MSASERLNQALSQADMQSLSHEKAVAFEGYLSLLTKWNAKLNLTAIRDTDTILRRHFVESIFCATKIPPGVHSLLDFGSGGGFPGVPIAICRPEIRVTLGESQSKKATFLREVVRTLGLSTSVEQRRAETLSLTFDAVTLRAVDKMEKAVQLASERVAEDGHLILMLSFRDELRFRELTPQILWQKPIPIPGSNEGCILLGQKSRNQL